MKWPKSLGQRDRAHQYDSYVMPLSAEEKIAETQKAHKKAQVDINKAIKLLERSIIHYTKSSYGSDKVIELIGKEIKSLKELQEDIKKKTYNALPYKELDQEPEPETKKKHPMLPIHLAIAALNTAFYLVGSLLQNSYLLLCGVINTALLAFYCYLRWVRKHRKHTPFHTVGPKIW